MMVRAVRAAFLAAAAVLVCCSPAQEKTTGGDSSEAPASGDWLVFGDTTEPSTLDCLRVNERAGRQICRLVADSLIDFDAHFRFVPRLAESFDVSPDGLAVTFRLRDGVQWHDGRPFTARDVLDTVDRIRHLDPDGQRYRDLFGPMDSVTLADDRTIRANYSEPFAGALVGWRETFIVPSQAGSATPRAPGAPAPENAPVGTGPFRFVSWEPQRQIILEANGGYFGGRPRIDRYIHRVVPNSEALRQALETGAVDVAGLTSSWMAGGRAQGDDGLPFRVHVFPTTYMQMVFWNIDAPGRLFADARVRTALTMLLDRDGYAERVHHGIYRPATTLIDPAIWGGDPALEPLPYDPAAAASLLDEAGVIDRDGDGVRETASGPMSFTLIYTPMTPGNAEIAGMLERSAAGAGIRVKLVGMEWAAMKPRVDTRRFEAAILQFRLEPLPDPFSYFHSSQIGSGFNYGGYRSEAFDELAAQSRRTLDPDRRAEQLVRMQRILHADQPCTFVSVPGVLLAVHKRFRTPEPTSAGAFNWYPSILEWWVPPAERKYR